MRPKMLLLCCLLNSLLTFGQQKTLNIAGIHQLVSQSQSENKLQVTARDRQATVNVNEQANLTVLAKVKAKYREVQQRFNTLGTAINLANIGVYARPMVNRIVSNQAQIIELAEKNPALIMIGYQAELQFAQQARDLLAYVAGLTLSLGDVNQMKASDRKMLFDYVLSELSTVQDHSGNMLNMMHYASLASTLKAANPFQDFIDADIAIAKEIIQNAKYLK
jgi:hypothetical protein